jgi:hypothetical protein
MKGSVHSALSVREYGGVPSDYQKIHDFLDMSKIAYPNTKHRAILHNSVGPFIAEKVFGVDPLMLKSMQEKWGWTDEEVNDILKIATNKEGTQIVNSDGVSVSVRAVAEEHIIQDMGKIPTLQDYLEDMPFYSWLGHGEKVIKRIVVENFPFAVK